MKSLASAILFGGLFCTLLACGSREASTSLPASSAVAKASTDAGPPLRSPDCPLEQPAPDLLPGVSAEHRLPSYWISLYQKNHDVDEILLSEDAIAKLNSSYRIERSGFFSQAQLLNPVNEAEMRTKIEERFSWMQGKLSSGEYRKEEGVNAFWPALNARFSPTWRVALEEVQLYCSATPVGFYDANATSTRINRNTCSAAHPQELIEVIASWPDGMSLARTATSWGFIKDTAALSTKLSESQASRYAQGPWAVLSESVTLGPGQESLARHTRLPFAKSLGGAGAAVLVASSRGIRSTQIPERSKNSSRRAFTRRAVIEEALSFLGQPYGFGGLDGGIDCSRLQLDLLGAFGIQLPRFSGWQSKAGTYSIDVAGVADEDKLKLIDEANQGGVVLMQLPGHIMLYLGRDRAGVPMALHALSYYLDTCASGEETTMVVGKVSVGGLELGRGTRKTALLERITRISIFGKGPPDSLRDIATLRMAAPVSKPSARVCRKLPGRRLFVSPKRPEQGQSVRVIATSRKDLGPVRLSFYDAKGRRHKSALAATNGPPAGYVGIIKPPSRGNWTVVLGDGDRQLACRTFRVARSKARPDWKEILKERRATRKRQKQSERRLARERRKRARKRKDLGAPPSASTAASTAVTEADVPDPQMLVDALAAKEPVWKLKRAWSPIYEDLYAVFVERLFDYPEGDDLTWSSLQAVLLDPEHNFLYDYFGKSEEDVLNFVPDCADLPYTLRAYFSWKLQLPFGVHLCDRARDHRPPICEMAGGNLLPKKEFAGEDRIETFKNFVNFHVRRTVHSSSGRTAPDDDLSDFYPVRLTRKSLRPGTLFTDPYGHLLVVVKWLAQGAHGYGALIGADAQPDGTVGRRRFWRGSFLFRPETKSGGAGFKAFRPWIYDKETEALVTLTNEDLLHNRTARFSREQYEGSESDFYDKMESLINPRPLDPVDKLRSLVDALSEQVIRRTTSVATGEQFMTSREFEAIDMPTGRKIFLTSGPWEDFSTPSRDWRLLIAIHTVLDFPEAVLRSPSQYGISNTNVADRVAKLRETLAKELASRPLPYTRSDGSTWTLTLKDLVDRRVSFEMSYNPNDCPEIRWAAPKGSQERSTCQRHAPDEQRTKMLEYRHWFSERRRPAS